MRGPLEDLPLLHAGREAARGGRDRHHPLRRTAERLLAPGAASRPGDLHARRPRPRHLLRRPADGPLPRRQGRALEGARVRPRPPHGREAGQALQGPAAPPPHLELARRQAGQAPARLRRGRHLGELALRGDRGRQARLPRHPVPPRGLPHRARRGHDPQLPRRRLRRAAGLDDEGLHRPRGGRHPRQGGEGARAPRPLRRRRLLGRGRAPAQGDRQAADLRLRRQRPPPPGRARVRPRTLRPAFPHRPARGGRVGALPPAPQGGLRPRDEAEDHRPHLRRGLRADAEEDRPPGGVPRPGHALSRRDRVRLDPGQPRLAHQDAPQRRRPARPDEAQAGRAAARAVQGRGPQGRRHARPAARGRLAAAVPRPGPRRPGDGRHHGRQAGHPAPRRRRPPRRDDEVGLVLEGLAVLRRLPAGQDRRRLRRRADLRLRHRPAHRREHRRHDGRLGEAAPRPHPAHLQPHHERGARRQPRGPRHQLEAPRACGGWHLRTVSGSCSA